MAPQRKHRCLCQLDRKLTLLFQLSERKVDPDISMREETSALVKLRRNPETMSTALERKPEALASIPGGTRPGRVTGERS